MTKERIDEIIDGLIEFVGSKNIKDILSCLGIHLLVVEPDNILLNGNRAVYNRIGPFECIYIANDLYNRDFVIAHELGHAVLHVEEATTFFNPLLNKGKLENEANYFAVRLLHRDLEIEDGIETKSQLAIRLGIKEDYIKYII